MSVNKITFLFFTVLFLFLCTNINTYIDKGDSGEFILTTKFLGNSHPSGYPLYNIVVKLFHVISDKPVLNVSIASVFFLCCSSFMVLLIIDEILENYFFSITGAFAFCMGNTILYTGLTQEIYSFFTFLFLLSTFFFIKYINNQSLNYYFLSSFCAGLLSAVHVTGLFYFLIFNIIFVILNIKEKERYRNIFFSILYYALPLILYLYVPLRNSAEVSWGNITDISSFFSHISGSERGVGARFFAFDIKDLFIQITVLLNHLYKEYYILFFFSIPGFYFLYKYEKKYFYTLTLPFLFCISFYISIARDLTHKAHFFVIAFAVFYIVCWTGFYWFYNAFFKKRRPFFLIVIPIALFFINQPDFSYGGFLESYRKNIINSIQKKPATLFVSSDELTFPFIYEKKVKGKLKEVKIINKDMLNSQWYKQRFNKMDSILEHDENVYFDTYPQKYFDYYFVPEGMLYRKEDYFTNMNLKVLEDLYLGGLEKEYVLPEVNILKSRYKEIFNNTAIQLVKEKKFEKAEHILSSVLKVQKDMSFFYNLNNIRNRNQIYKDKIEEYIDKKYFNKAEDLLKEKNDNKRLAELYWKTKNISKLENMEKIPTLYKGLLLFYKEEYEKSLNILKKYTQSRDAIFYSALIYNKMNMPKESIRLLEYLYKNFPEDEEVYKVLHSMKGYVNLK